MLQNPDLDSSVVAAGASTVPNASAGDGAVGPPTQVYTDLFTIRKELGTVNGLITTYTRDLRQGRSIYALLQLLAYCNIRV